MRGFRRRRPLGYQRFKEFVLGKELPVRSVPAGLDEADLPRRRPGGTTFVRERTSLIWFPFLHVYNKLRYTMVARVVGLVVVLALVMTGSWLAVIKSRVTRQTQWLEGRDNVVIAVMGKDDVEGLGRSDTLILVNFRPAEKQVRLLSVPRDSRAPINKPDGHGKIDLVYSKINHALRWGGYALTKDTVKHYLGVTIDYHFIISYGLFVEMIDFVGGIPLEVEKRMYYVDRAGGLTIDLHPGFQILDGNRALQYVRFRHDGGGDIGRIARQQKFIAAAAAHVKQPQNFVRLLKSAPDLLKHISTDIPLELALSMLARFRDVDLKDVVTKTIPGKEMNLPPRRGSSTRLSYYVSSRDEAMGVVNDFLLASPTGPGTAEPDPTAFPDLDELCRPLEPEAPDPAAKPPTQATTAAAAVATSTNAHR